MGFMSRKYLPVNREKPMFLPLDMQSWVPKDHFVWFLVDVAGQLDTSALQAGTSPGRGRPGYDPQAPCRSRAGAATGFDVTCPGNPNRQTDQDSITANPAAILEFLRPLACPPAAVPKMPARSR